ncbi:O-antigen ligase family protein [Thermodesulfobacteriota bacterium]
MLLVLVYSGNQAPGRIFPIDPQLVALALFLGFLFIRRSHRIFSFDFVLIGGIFACLLLVQCVDFSFYPFVSMAGFFVRLFIGFTLIRLVDNFPRVFVRAMVGLALLSFAFHLPYLLLSTADINMESIITRLAELLGTASVARRPLLLHTFMGDFSPGNAGMFWEPGAFAGYLILALVLLALVKDEITKQDYKRYFIILSIALVTTLSTTGYVSFPLVLLLHYNWQGLSLNETIGRWLLAAYVVLPLMIMVLSHSYQTIDFLQAKIDHQLQVIEYREGRWHRGRIGSIIFDWEYVKRRPLSGWGLHSSTRYSLHPWMESSEGMGNGFSDFIAKFGIFGMLVFLTHLYWGVMYYTERNMFKSLYILVIVVMLLQGEAFFGYPLFLGLMFLSGALKEKQKVLVRPLSVQSV